MLMACSAPFTFGNFIVYRGRNSYNLMSAQVSNYFVELRDDIEAVTYGLYFCEFVDYYTKENKKCKAIDLPRACFFHIKVYNKPIEIKARSSYVFKRRTLYLSIQSVG